MDKNRAAAYQVLLETEEKGAYSNLALNGEIKKQAPDSPAFVRELVYGVLENRILLDHILSQYLKKPLSSMKGREKTLLRMGIYQINEMDSVPDHAAVNETVNMAKKVCRGREGFINGVLRAYLRAERKYSLPDPKEDPTGFLSVKYSCEPWIVELWQAEYGRERAEALLSAGNRRPELTVRVNGLKTSGEMLKKALEDRGYAAELRQDVPEGLNLQGSGLLEDPAYQQGLFSVQDGASMLAVLALDPKPGEFIVDVCAAPGGKTVYIAERMKNRGKILAGDFYPAKLKLIEKQAERCGVDIIETREWDAALPDPGLTEKADRVLADVPCSGLGVIRRKPEIKYKKFNRELEDLPQKQAAILRASAEYVKPGGVLVYSTCTVRRAENQDVIRQFLAEDDRFQMETERQLLPDTDGTDGFYLCRMKRKQQA